jgi:exopolyphosphatase/pppGpp-phosphohydrolase
MSVIAVVDVGSNSIKVAVISAADRRELGRKSEAVRLQPEGGPAEPFSSESRAEAVAAIGRLVAYARSLGATRLCLSLIHI